MKKTLLTILGTAAIAACIPAQAQIVVNINSQQVITDNFREIRANDNDPDYTATGGPGGGAYARITPTADGGAVRLAYDANGATAGTNTYSTGFVAMDVNWALNDQQIGLFFGPSTTDALGWMFRLNNGGTWENGQGKFAINNTNNFSAGTVLTTTSATALTNFSGTPGLNAGSTNVYANVNLLAGSWYSMRLDFGLNGSNERTLQFRVWNNVLDGSGVGTGTLVWNQSVDIVGTNYNGVGEVGIFAAGNTALDVGFQNFTVIPEPATWALLAGGLTTLIAFRRRRA